MPTVLRSGPYRFFFYAGDGSEPPHIHVERDRCLGKWWLDPIRYDNSDGFSGKEINRIEKIIQDNIDHLLESWHDFFHD